MCPKGYTLLELICSMAIFTVVFPIVLVWLIHLNQSFFKLEQQAFMHNEWLYLSTHLRSECLDSDTILSYTPSTVTLRTIDSSTMQIFAESSTVKVKKGQANAYKLTSELPITSVFWQQLSPNSVRANLQTPWGNWPIIVGPPE